MVKIIGILNITPDSFSDGGKYNNYVSSIQHTKKIIQDGAHIIDIGAESTRPGAIPIKQSEEIYRLTTSLKEIIAIAHDSNVQVSIDTYKPEVAQFAISCGVDIINDVTGFTNPNMIKLATQNKHIKLISMHSLGAPTNSNVCMPDDCNPTIEILNWAKSIVQTLEQHGIKRESIIIDPGVGFGKNTEQSWHIINNIEAFKPLGIEINVGHSRKRFLRLDNQHNNQDTYTLATSTLLALKGVHYIRVHNVKLHHTLFKKLSLI